MHGEPVFRFAVESQSFINSTRSRCGNRLTTVLAHICIRTVHTQSAAKHSVHFIHDSWWRRCSRPSSFPSALIMCIMMETATDAARMRPANNLARLGNQNVNGTPSSIIQRKNMYVNHVGRRWIACFCGHYLGAPGGFYMLER